MTLIRHNPIELPTPSGFTHAVTATGGDLVFLAGQTAQDASGAISGDGVVAQLELALTNLLTALAAAGGSPTDLVRVTIYAVDVEDYRSHSAEIGKVWRRLVGRDYPTMALIGVTRLWDTDALVELDGIAVVPTRSDTNRRAID